MTCPLAHIIPIRRCEGDAKPLVSVDGWSFVPQKNTGGTEGVRFDGAAVAMAQRSSTTDGGGRFRFSSLSFILHAGFAAALSLATTLNSFDSSTGGGERAIEVQLVEASEYIGQQDRSAAEAQSPHAAAPAEAVQPQQQAITAQNSLEAVAQLPLNTLQKIAVKKEQVGAYVASPAAGRISDRQQRAQAASQSGQGSRVAGQDAPTLDLQAETSSYQRRVATHLARYKRYPAEARERRQEGQNIVSFSIDAQGVVQTVRVNVGSGFSMLDQETEATVRRASPFPAIPPQLNKRAMSFTVPMRYDLRS